MRLYQVMGSLLLLFISVDTRNEPHQKNAVYDMSHQLSSAPAMTSNSFLAQQLAHRPHVSDMQTPSYQQQRPYGTAPAMTSAQGAQGSMQSQNPDSSHWGAPGQYMPGSYLGVGPIGTLSNMGPYGAGSGHSWGPPPTTMSSGQGHNMTGMPNSRTMYGAPDQMSSGMYGMTWGDQQNRQQYNTEAQKPDQQEAEKQNTTVAPPQTSTSIASTAGMGGAPIPAVDAIDAVQKQPKQRRKRKKSPPPESLGPGQEAMSGPSGTAAAPNANQAQYMSATCMYDPSGQYGTNSVSTSGQPLSTVPSGPSQDIGMGVQQGQGQDQGQGQIPVYNNQQNPQTSGVYDDNSNEQQTTEELEPPVEKKKRKERKKMRTRGRRGKSKTPEEEVKLELKDEEDDFEEYEEIETKKRRKRKSTPRRAKPAKGGKKGASAKRKTTKPVKAVRRRRAPVDIKEEVEDEPGLDDHRNASTTNTYPPTKDL